MPLSPELSKALTVYDDECKRLGIDGSKLQEDVLVNEETPEWAASWRRASNEVRVLMFAQVNLDEIRKSPAELASFKAALRKASLLRCRELANGA